MTLILMVSQLSNIAALASSVLYLLTMVLQILLFCWVGNEVIYSVRNENFADFDYSC
jgi:hypothetical protein